MKKITIDILINAIQDEMEAMHDNEKCDSNFLAKQFDLFYDHEIMDFMDIINQCNINGINPLNFDIELVGRDNDEQAPCVTYYSKKLDKIIIFEYNTKIFRNTTFQNLFNDFVRIHNEIVDFDNNITINK